jgi:opacity protein-like surface antigen
MKKFLIMAGLLTVIATPAFAQDFIPSEGTGNVLPSYYDASGHLIQGVAPQTVARAKGDNAENAFAMAPRGNANNVNVDPDSPANTGGGSEGYNWNLSHVQD